MKPGQTLELGSGPGFFAEYNPGMINTDISPTGSDTTLADVHALPFADGCFTNIVGVDVLHHFAQPGLALRECSRVLSTGGRLILIEPWTSPFGWLFYRFIHHEECSRVADPWTGAFPAEKNPMQGNAMIPRLVFDYHRPELTLHAPGLRVTQVEPFGILSFLLTGGLQKWGFPRPTIQALCHLEKRLPRLFIDFFATRALCIVEKT